MKTETKLKLTRLSAHIVRKFGLEIIETDKFLNILKKEADAISIKIHYNTIRDNEKFVIERMKIEARDLFFQNLKTTPVKVEEPKAQPEPVKIKVFFSDGSHKYFIPEVEKPIEKPVEKPIEKPVEKPVQVEKVWTGLFDYKPDGKIFIRRGKRYNGVEITNINEVLRHFRTLERVIGWIDWQLDPKILQTLKFSTDTERDIKCLQDFRIFIERKMTGIKK